MSKNLVPPNVGASASTKKHRSRQQWQELVDAYEHSGLSQAAFCSRQGISVASLSNWRKRLSQTGEQVQPSRTSAFIELLAPEQSASQQSMTLRLDLGQGIVLTVSRT